MPDPMTDDGLPFENPDFLEAQAAHPSVPRHLHGPEEPQLDRIERKVDEMLAHFGEIAEQVEKASTAIDSFRNGGLPGLMRMLRGN